MSASLPPGPRAAAGRRQLALQFPLSSRFRFDNFVAGANDELVRRIEQLPAEGTGFRGCYLFGDPGAGRSHLLQAACHLHGARGGAIYLPLAELPLTPASADSPAPAVDLLDGLDSLALVALDDVEAWVGDERGEAALLGLYQGLLASGGCLLVSARVTAARLGFRYADLASRLRALPTYQLRGLDDAGKTEVLGRLARERGLELTAPVLDFWLARSSRHLADLLAQFEQLDAAAMVAQRRVTVPLVKEVLGL
jgi:DnaA-homolog protein